MPLLQRLSRRQKNSRTQDHTGTGSVGAYNVLTYYCLGFRLFWTWGNHVSLCFPYGLKGCITQKELSKCLLEINMSSHLRMAGTAFLNDPIAGAGAWQD